MQAGEIKSPLRTIMIDRFAQNLFSGIVWATASYYAIQILTLVLDIFISRILSPTDFGIIALSITILELLTIPTLWSFNAAIIHYRGDDEQRLIQTALTLSLLIGIISFLFVSILCVTFLTRYYDHTVIYIIIFFSLVQTIVPLGFTCSASLEKLLNYKTIGIIQNTEVVGRGFVSIILAKLGYGTWSLALGKIIGNLYSSLYYIRSSKIFPSFTFNLQHARWLLKFGARVQMARALEIVYYRLDNFIIGTFMGTSPLGIYSKGFTLSELGARFVSAASNTVALPMFAKVQDDRIKLSSYYSITVALLIRVLWIFALLFILAGPEIVNLIYGTQWLQSGYILQALVIYAVLIPIYENAKQLLYAVGLPGTVAQIRFVQVIVFVPLLIGLIYYKGIVGAAFAVNVNVMIGIICIFYSFSKEKTVDISSFRKSYIVINPTICGLIALFSGFGIMSSLSVTSAPDGTLVNISISLTCVCIYLALLLIADRTHILNIIQYIRLNKVF